MSNASFTSICALMAANTALNTTLQLMNHEAEKARDEWDNKVKPGDALAGDVLYEDFLRSSYR